MKQIKFIIGCIGLSSYLAGQTCEPENNCCNPCSDYTAYPPQYHDLNCDLGFFLTVDFLYWYARENDLVWGTRAKIIDFGGVKGAATPWKHLHFDAQWHEGIRIGIGSNFGCDGWDLYINWLYLLCPAKDSVQFSWDNKPIADIGQIALYNPWTYGSWFNPSFWQSGFADWCLNFDQMDLELGRKYWLSRCFNLRPYAGLRGTWMHTRFHVDTELNLEGIEPPLQPTPNFNLIYQNNHNLIQNHYWGVGLLGGLQPNWAICRDLFIFGNLSGSLVWGKFWAGNSAKANIKGNLIDGDVTVFKEFSVSNHEKEDLDRMQAMLDLAIGLRWERCWCDNRFRTSIDVGWEHHFWFNFGLRHHSTGAFDKEIPGLSNSNTHINSYYLTETDLITDLELGGLVIRGRIDF